MLMSTVSICLKCPTGHGPTDHGKGAEGRARVESPLLHLCDEGVFPFPCFKMKTILTINSGSSSVKASLFAADGARQDFRYAHLREPRVGFDLLMHDLHGQMPDVVGHRFVHGGEISEAARLVDETSRRGCAHWCPSHRCTCLEICSA